MSLSSCRMCSSPAGSTGFCSPACEEAFYAGFKRLEPVGRCRQNPSWRTASITAIAKTLFCVHGFDADRAVAIAFWFKKGRIVRTGPGYYWSRFSTTETLPDLTESDAMDLLRRYRAYMGSDAPK